MSQKLKVERKGHVLCIGLNRPEKYNAMDVELYLALADAYGGLQRDGELLRPALRRGPALPRQPGAGQVGPAVRQRQLPRTAPRRLRSLRPGPGTPGGQV